MVHWKDTAQRMIHSWISKCYFYLWTCQGQRMSSLSTCIFVRFSQKAIVCFRTPEIQCTSRMDHFYVCLLFIYNMYCFISFFACCILKLDNSSFYSLPLNWKKSPGYSSNCCSPEEWKSWTNSLNQWCPTRVWDDLWFEPCHINKMRGAGGMTLTAILM